MQEEPITTSAEQLRDEAIVFLRRFGLVTAVWATLLATAVPDPGAGRPMILWVGIATLWVWALVSQVVANPWVWGFGWVVAAAGLELLGPFAATNGWSVTGGASFIVLASAALTGRRRVMVATVVLLSVLALLRGFIATGWNVGGSIGTILIFAFGGLALSWLSRILLSVLTDRDRLQAQLMAIETKAARQHERQESAARLHDTVLQHLTAVTHAEGVEDARRQAGRASNQLRQFLRTPEPTTATNFREAMELAVTEAADGTQLSISVVGVRQMDEPAGLLVAATAEAVRNAVAHGAPPIRVFAEAGDATTTVWVADHGTGFDLASIPEARLGVRESIIGRLGRAGGVATVRVSETGTEWELQIPTTAG